MFSKKLLLAAPLLAGALLTGVGATSASASTTDATLTGSDSSHLANGKFAEGSAIWTRASNRLDETLHVETPYLFVGARGTISATIYANTPIGPVSLWSVSHGLTACGKWDPTCSSSPSQTWHDYPNSFDWQKLQQYGEYMTVSVTVN